MRDLLASSNIALKLIWTRHELRRTTILDFGRQGCSITIVCNWPDTLKSQAIFKGLAMLIAAEVKAWCRKQITSKVWKEEGV